MATLTKTYTDNHYDSSTYKKTWTITYNFNDITASNSTFAFVTPTIQAKFTGTKGLYRYTEVNMAILYIDNVMYDPGGSYGDDSWFWSNPANYMSNFIAGASNTVFTITKRTKDPMDQLNSYPHSFVINTADYFDSNNKTSKTLTVKASFFLMLETNSLKDGTGYTSRYYNSDSLTYTLGTVTLNAPPTATYTVNTSGTYYSKAGGFTGSNYNISVSYAAQYGGDVTSIKLQVGDSINEFNPNRASGQKDLSIYTTQTGTFTPTLTITDTRGQIQVINLPSITVQPYGSPTLDYNIQRTNSQGQPADEGTYARINTNLTYFNIENNHILEPTVVIKDGDATLTTTKTWYTANGNPISDWSTITTPAAIYAIVSKSNGFAIDKSYNVSVTLTDTNGVSSQTISQILPTAFYMLDFRAGSHGMAIGKVADKDGLEIQFPTMIGQGLSTPLTNGEIDITKYQLVVGKYNEIDNDAVFIIGNGTNGAPKNIMAVKNDGNLELGNGAGQIKFSEYLDNSSNTIKRIHICSATNVLDERKQIIISTKNNTNPSKERYSSLDLIHNYTDTDGEEYAASTLGTYLYFNDSTGSTQTITTHSTGFNASSGASSIDEANMSATWTDYHSNNDVYDNYTASIGVSAGPGTGGLINMSADNIKLTGAGNLTLAGHSSPIGSVYEHTASSVSLTSTAAQDQGTGKTILSCTGSHIIPAGCWIGFIYVNFSASASTVVGFNMSTSNTSAAWSTQMHASELGYGTRIRQPVIISIANNTDYYVRAWSREDCTVNTVTVRLMRIK